MQEPKVVAVRVNFGGGGKVAIQSYGNVTSDYHASISRDYAIPEDWTEDQVMEFELAKVAQIRGLIDPILQAEFDERYEQSYLSVDARR